MFLFYVDVFPPAPPLSNLPPSTLAPATQTPAIGNSTLSKKRPPPPPPGHKRTLSDPPTPLSYTPLCKGGIHLSNNPSCWITRVSVWIYLLLLFIFVQVFIHSDPHEMVSIQFISIVHLSYCNFASTCQLILFRLFVDCLVRVPVSGIS